LSAGVVFFAAGCLAPADLSSLAFESVFSKPPISGMSGSSMPAGSCGMPGNVASLGCLDRGGGSRRRIAFCRLVRATGVGSSTSSDEPKTLTPASVTPLSM